MAGWDDIPNAKPKDEWDSIPNATSTAGLFGPTQSQISTAPPRWMELARTPVEMLGFLGGPWGYAGAKTLYREGMKGLGYGTPPRPAYKEDVEKEVGFPLTEQEYQNVLQTNKGFQAPPDDLMTKALQGMSDVTSGYLFKQGGDIISNLIGKALPFYAKGLTPEAQQLSRVAQQEGVHLPASVITGNRAQMGLEAVIEKMPQTAGIAQKQSERVTQSFNAMLDRNLDKIGGRIEPTPAGASVKKGIDIAREKAVKEGEALYSEAMDLAKSQSVNFKNTVSAIDDVYQSDSFAIMSKENQAKVRDVLEFVKSKMKSKEEAIPPSMILGPSGQPAMMGGTKPIIYDKPFFDAESTRKTLAGKLFSREVSGTEVQRPLRQVYGALEKDMEEASGRAGSQAYESFQAARENWSKSMWGVFKGEGGKQTAIEKLQMMSPEKIGDYIKTADLNNVRLIKKTIPVSHFNDVKRDMLTKVFSSGARESATGETVYNGVQIANAIRNLKPERLKTVFSPEEYQMLERVALLSEKMGTAWKIMGNPSGTAHTLYTMGLMSGIGGAAGAAATGNIEGMGKGAAVGAGAFVAPNLLARLITSSAGRKWMISGIPGLLPTTSKIIGETGVLGRSLMEQAEEQRRR